MEGELDFAAPEDFCGGDDFHQALNGYFWSDAALIWEVAGAFWGIAGLKRAGLEERHNRIDIKSLEWWSLGHMNEADWKLVIDGEVYCEIVGIIMDGAARKYERTTAAGVLESVAGQELELTKPVIMDILDSRRFEVLIDGELIVPLEVFEGSVDGMSLIVLPNPE